MAKKRKAKFYDYVDNWLRDHGFDILETPGAGASGRIFLKKYNVSAAIEKSDDGGSRVFAHPGYLIGGEISKLVDKGYQKFLKTTKLEVAATADHLKALHDYTEELKEAIAATSLYNESLGSVSESHQYDRVKDRDQAETSRPKRPWQELAGAKRRA